MKECINLHVRDILHYEKLAFEEAERTLKEYELANSIRIEEEIDKDLLIAIVKLNSLSRPNLSFSMNCEWTGVEKH